MFSVTPLPTIVRTRPKKFYNRLWSVVRTFSRRDINIFMGDFNAKVGRDNRGFEDIMGQQGLGVMNDNEEVCSPVRHKQSCHWQHSLLP